MIKLLNSINLIKFVEFLTNESRSIFKYRDELKLECLDDL
jgi:hypothetical protein